MSLLAVVGNAIAWIFTPLGWGNWQAAVASITGLIAKENIVGTMGVLYGGRRVRLRKHRVGVSPPWPGIPSWPSTCCAPPALPPSAPSSGR